VFVCVCVCVCVRASCVTFQLHNQVTYFNKFEKMLRHPTAVPSVSCNHQQQVKSATL